MKQLFLLIGFCLSFGLFAQEKPSVIFSEVMANPKGLGSLTETEYHLPETEYIELQNVSDHPVSLKGWRFYYDNKGVELTDITLPAKGFIVLYYADREIFVGKDGLHMPLGSPFPDRLNNDGKDLKLYDANGSLQDAVTYSAKAGKSWERDGNSWDFCSDPLGGTPGAANSVGKSQPSQPENPAIPSSPTSGYAQGCLRINEIMADPNGLKAFPQSEYVELFNTTEATLPLANWQFVYGGKGYPLPAYTLPAKGYVVLYRDKDTVSVDAYGGKLPMKEFPRNLSNAGKELALLDPSGKVIDQVTYKRAKAGKSWERPDNGELYLSTDPRGGTPGTANSPKSSSSDDRPTTPINPDRPSIDTSVLPGEIVINELLPAPWEGGTEYIELYNRSGETRSLAGLALATRRTDGSLGTHYPLTSIQTPLEADGYALLSKQLSGVEEFYHIASPQALHELKLPILANNQACLVLFRIADEQIIDEVCYSSKWHDKAIKDQKGVALERINPDGPSQEASNWQSAAATAGFGTPGYRNSQQATSITDIEGFERPQWSEAERIYQLRYQLQAAGYRCRIWVFDTAGRRIAEIANITTLATEGSLSWDGLANDGSRPKPGIYICYIELFHPDGRTVTQREVFLVH